MAKRAPIKLSGLVQTGAVVASTSPHAAPDETVQNVQAKHVEKGEASSNDQIVIAGQGREMRHIPVHMIDPNPLAPREVYTPQMILDRAEDLRTQGQHDPIHVTRNPDQPGRYLISDGWTRVQACVVHKVQDSLLAEVHEMAPLESAWFGFEQNEGREQQCDLDRAMFFEKMIAAGEQPAALVQRARITRSMMTFYRSFSKLPEEVLEIVRDHPRKFGAMVAYQLSKLNEKCGVRKTVALAARYAAEDQPVRWLTNQVQNVINKPAAGSFRSPFKHQKFVNGHYKQKEDQFDLSIKVTDEQRRHQFALDLEELIKRVAILEVPAGDTDRGVVVNDSTPSKTDSAS